MQWRPECEGAAYPLHLLSDHKNIEYCITKRLLNCRQVCWLQFVIRFDYQIVQGAGKSNGMVDAVTRKVGDLPQGGG